jgi:hypothetical protein
MTNGRSEAPLVGEGIGGKIGAEFFWVETECKTGEAFWRKAEIKDPFTTPSPFYFFRRFVVCQRHYEAQEDVFCRFRSKVAVKSICALCMCEPIH